MTVRRMFHQLLFDMSFFLGNCQKWDGSKVVMQVCSVSFKIQTKSPYVFVYKLNNILRDYVLDVCFLQFHFLNHIICCSYSIFKLLKMKLLFNKIVKQALFKRYKHWPYTALKIYKFKLSQSMKLYIIIKIHYCHYVVLTQNNTQ